MERETGIEPKPAEVLYVGRRDLGRYILHN